MKFTTERLRRAWQTLWERERVSIPFLSEDAAERLFAQMGTLIMRVVSEPIPNRGRMVVLTCIAFNYQGNRVLWLPYALTPTTIPRGQWYMSRLITKGLWDHATVDGVLYTPDAIDSQSAYT